MGVGGKVLNIISESYFLIDSLKSTSQKGSPGVAKLWSLRDIWITRGSFPGRRNRKLQNHDQPPSPNAGNEIIRQKDPEHSLETYWVQRQQVQPKDWLQPAWKILPPGRRSQIKTPRQECPRPLEAYGCDGKAKGVQRRVSWDQISLRNRPKKKKKKIHRIYLLWAFSDL